ncbi:hypothetical protein FHL15_001325 [Xylaria flabelliformis]|uniref:RING-type domain-containing protein n=1 Tax=Xylaria flabelliformis TaxID=2512241 RepID=A0A553IBJ1_9PEZI|nr:hypothetical protein FHL15_001325 [Xylaria flabelliformis]
MATSGNRLEVLAAVNFVESQFPNGQAHKSHPWGVSNPAHSCPHSPPQGPPPGVSADEYFSGLPNSPPPGLVRVLPAKPAPVRLITNETASLFGDFARYIDDGVDEDGNPVVVDLTCCICMESKLSVSTCQAANNSPGNSSPFEELTIMPCGHFMGLDCLYNWLLTTDWRNPTCPLCRFKLVYGCGHDLEPKEYTPLRPRREQIPLTLPEGGRVPHSCDICYEKCIKQTLSRLRSFLFPSDIVAGDLKYENSAEILRNTSALFKRRALNYLCMNEHYIRW